MKFYPTYFYPRSGSTVVDYTLNQHPEVIALNEPYMFLKNDLKHDSIDFKSFMEPVIRKLPKDKNKKIASFQYCTQWLKDLFVDEVTINNHFPFIQQHFDKLIVIRRRNLLKQYSSFIGGFQYRRWHYHVDRTQINNQIELLINVPVVVCQRLLPNKMVTTMSLVNFLTEYQHYIDRDLDCLAHSNMSWLDIVYEDHIEQSPLTAVKMIEDFLQLTPYNQYNIPLKKIASTLQQDLINFDEVAEHLRGSDHAWMLE
jgi:hypothetical protein